MRMWTDIASLSFNVKDIIAHLAALSCKLFMWNFRSSPDHGSPVIILCQVTPQLCNDASELIIIIKRSPIAESQFFSHHNSSFLASIEIATLSSKGLQEINFWICWCWRWQYWRGAGRTAIVVDNNLPISLLSSLTVTFPFYRISWQWFCTFSSFSLGKLKVISPESTIPPKNSKVDVGSRYE